MKNISDLEPFSDDERSKTSRVESMFEDIQRLKDDGISYRTIAARLSAAGIAVSEQDLTSMLSRIKKKRSRTASKPGTRLHARPASNFQVGVLSPLQNSEVLSPPEEGAGLYAHQKDGKLVADEVW